MKVRFDLFLSSLSRFLSPKPPFEIATGLSKDIEWHADDYFLIKLAQVNSILVELFNVRPSKRSLHASILSGYFRLVIVILIRLMLVSISLG